jgi:signal transduction histidine kinase
MGESKKALEYGKKALNIAEQLKVPLGIARQQVSLGLAYNTLQSYDSALRLFNAALPVLSKAKTNADLLTTYEAIIKASTGLSNHKQAVTYYQKYNSLKDSLQREEQNTALDSLRVKFNTEQTINENLLLAQKNLVQSKTISLQKTIMASAFLFAFLLIGFVVFVIRSRQKIRSANQLLAAQNDEITAKAQELDTKNRQLVELSQYKDSMNSFLVHDLKNPLNTIINANWGQLSPQEAEGIKHSGYRMLNIVSSLLDISKHENNMLNIFIADTQIAQVIRDAFNETHFLAKQKNIRIALKFQTNFLLKVDSELIKRVLVNMLTNAIKFSQTNGQIQVFAEALSDSNLKISIKDDGEGIASEYLPFVFERFTQGIPRNVGLTASTGIGMAFCKMAIELHGGEIGVDSVQGSGTTFWFTLPLAALYIQDKNASLPDDLEPRSFAHIQLTISEKEYLKGFCKQLQQLTIYQLSEVKDVVKPIESSSPTIILWKQLVLESLAACNETNYHKLINICHA